LFNPCSSSLTAAAGTQNLQLLIKLKLDHYWVSKIKKSLDHNFLHCPKLSTADAISAYSSHYCDKSAVQPCLALKLKRKPKMKNYKELSLKLFI